MIGLDILDMWSVLCSHVGGWVWYGDRTGHTGYIVSVMSFTRDGWSSTVTGLDIKDMWSMLFFTLLGGGIYYIVIQVDELDMWSVICVSTLGCRN